MIMYVDYFNGIAKPENLLKSKTIRLYTTDSNNKDYWLASAPWREDIKIDVQHKFDGLQENWGEAISTAIGKGRGLFDDLENNLYSLINKGTEFATTILKQIGWGDNKITQWIDKAKEWVDKQAGDTSSGTYKRYYSQDILQQFNGSDINPNGVIQNLEFVVLSNENLKEVLRSLPDRIQRDFPGLNNGKSVNKSEITVNKSEVETKPVKAYIDYLITMIGPKIEIYKAGTSIESGMISAAPNGYHRPIEKDFGKRVLGSLYAVAGENLYIENLLPVSLNIDIPSFRTVEGDFLFAKINIGLKPAMKVTTDELKKWINGAANVFKDSNGNFLNNRLDKGHLFNN